MKIQKLNSKTIFVISGGNGGGCPSLIVTSRKNAYLRDDYYGGIRLSKGILRKLSSV